MATSSELRPWSSLGEAEQARLLADYQPVLDSEAPTCSFETKLARMQTWLGQRGVSISEAEIRRPRRMPA